MVSLYLLVVLCNTVAALTLSSASFAGTSNSTLRPSTSANGSFIQQINNTAPITATTALIADTVSVVTIYRWIEQTQTKYVNFCACPSSVTGAAGNQISSGLDNPDSSGITSTAVGHGGANDLATDHSVSTNAGSAASRVPESVDAVQGQQDQHFVISVTIATVYQTLAPEPYTTTISLGGSTVVQTLTTTSTKTLLTTSTITLPVIVNLNSGSGVDSNPIYSNSTISAGTANTPSSLTSSTQFTTTIVTSTLSLDSFPTTSIQTTSNKAGAGIGGAGRSTTTTSYRTETSSTTLFQLDSQAQSSTSSIAPTTTSSARIFAETSSERSSTLTTALGTTSDYSTASASILAMSSSSSSSKPASISSTISSSLNLELTTSGSASMTLSLLDTISSSLASSITASAAPQSIPTVSTTYTTSEAVSALSSTDFETTFNTGSSSSSDMPSQSTYATSSPASATSTDSSSSTSSTTTSSTTTSVAIPSAVPSPQAVVNSDFETDLDGSGSYTSPWVFSGNGDVQSNPNNAYQAYSGEHFAVLYGRSSTSVFVSQTLLGVEPGSTYTLSYIYNVYQASPQAICSFSVTLGNKVVDNFQSPTTRTNTYLNRQVTYVPPADSDGTVLLGFTLVCPRFVQLTAQSNFALDLITLTLD